MIPSTDDNCRPSLDLALEQVANHLAAGDARGVPQRRKVQSAGETVGEAKEQHGRDPATGVLECEAALGHLVLLGNAAVHEVDAAGRVLLRLVRARSVRPLLALEDVEVVIGRVSTRVALGAHRGAEDDEVFGYT